MNLKTYLRQKKISVAAFAPIVKVHSKHLEACINGRRSFSAGLAYKIMEATNNEVKLEDLIMKKVYYHCPLCSKQMGTVYLPLEEALKKIQEHYAQKNR